MNNNNIKQEAQASDDDDSMPDGLNLEHDLYPPSFQDHKIYEQPMPDLID